MSETIEIIGLVALTFILLGLASIIPMIVYAAYRDLIKGK